MAESHTTKKHIKCFILCTLLESHISTLPSYHFALKQKSTSPQLIFKTHLLQILDHMVDCSESITDLRSQTISSLSDESDGQKLFCWLSVEPSENNEKLREKLLGPGLFREVIFVLFQELGLFFKYVEDYFGIRFKAVITKAVANDKYFFLLNPPIRNFDPEDVSGPLFCFEEMNDLQSYGRSLLDSFNLLALKTTKLEDMLIYSEHIFSYTNSFNDKPACLMAFYTYKCLWQALNQSSIDKGKVWLDKLNEMVEDCQL